MEGELKKARNQVKTLKQTIEKKDQEVKASRSEVSQIQRKMERSEGEHTKERSNYQNELNSFANAKFGLEDQIVNQKRIIQVLQQRVCKYEDQKRCEEETRERSKMEELHLMLQGWDRHQSEHRIRFITSLNEQLQRMLDEQTSNNQSIASETRKID